MNSNINSPPQYFYIIHPIGGAVSINTDRKILCRLINFR